MARPEKVAVVEEVAEQLRASAATLVTDYRGLSVGEMAELRAALREAGATYRVVKNTLTRRALRATGIDGLEGLERFLSGPTALTFCRDDPVAPAKALQSFAREHEELVLKGGFVEGQVLDAGGAARLAELLTREEQLTRMAQLLNGSLVGFARLMNESLARMARVLGALHDQREAAGEELPAEPAAAAAESPEAPAEAEAESAAPEPEAEPAAEAAPGPEPDAATPEPAAETPADPEAEPDATT